MTDAWATDDQPQADSLPPFDDGEASPDDEKVAAILGAGYPPCSTCGKARPSMTAKTQALAASGAETCPGCGRPR
jgi:hypothetical protein